MNRCSRAAFQTGMTLLEILIAMSIGLFLLAGVTQIFIGSKQTYRLQEAMSRVQENSRFAMDFISRDVRMAGYMGCYAGGGIENLLNDPTNTGWNLNSLVNGFDNVAAGFATIPNVVVNTDVIIVKELETANTPVTALHDGGVSPTGALTVDSSFNSGCTATDCHKGEILLVTDCSQASLFQITDVQTSGANLTVAHTNSNTFTPGNNSASISNSYSTDAQAYRLQTYAYYIRMNSATPSVPSLYRSLLQTAGGITLALTPEELVEGIENLQILYGADTDADGTANYYVPAGTAGLNMSQVVAVRVSLLARSLADRVTSTPVSYNYNFATTTPADRRLRRVVTSTIALRNRLL